MLHLTSWNDVEWGVFRSRFLHSASLMADAGHSLSDLLGDFVTLFCWQLSRRPKSNRYPYGMTGELL